MDNSLDDVLKMCRQLKNMFKFLLVSIKSDNKLTPKDICEFLERMDFLMSKICEKLEK